MGRPIKTVKITGDGVLSDSGYDNADGLGVVGGNNTTTGKQIQCDFQLNGTPYTGWIVRQKGARKFLVSDGTVTGTCALADTIAADGDMTVTITTAASATKRLAKFGDTIGTAFDGTTYHLTFNSASAVSPRGSTFEIAQVASI